MSTLYQVLRSVALQRPKHTAIIEPDGYSICYQELLEKIDCLSFILFDRFKEEERPRVGLLMESSIAQIVSVFALSKINAVVVPLNPKLKDAQICHALSNIGVLLLIVEADRTISCKDGVQISTYSVLTRFSNAAQYENAVTLWNEDDTFLVTLSSGSTGTPKPIMLSEQSKLMRAQQTSSLYGLSADDVVFNASPFFHSLGQRLTFVPLLMGATLVVMGQFTPHRWIDAVAKARVTFTIAVSSHLYALRDQLVSHREQLSSLHTVVSSSAAIDKDLKEYLFEQIGCAFYEIYGATEVAIATNLEPKDAAEKSASVGTPCSGVDLLILDDARQRLPADKVGEIACRSPLMFSGYLNQPEQSQQALHQGYFLTGDLGYLDQDGFLYFVSRKKDVIVSGGSNIYPLDIEGVILEHEAIAECAVIGINDSYLGEAIVAVCVWAPGSDPQEWAVRQWVNNQLSPFQRPLKYFFVDQLPLTSTGKLNKRALREHYNTLGLDLSAMVRALNSHS